MGSLLFWRLYEEEKDDVLVLFSVLLKGFDVIEGGFGGGADDIVLGGLISVCCTVKFVSCLLIDSD